jgi:hypothetical protein
MTIASYKSARTQQLRKIAENPTEYRMELFGIRDSLNGTIWGIKNAQWKILNYAILLDVALVLAIEKLGGLNGPIRSSTGAWLSLAFFWSLILFIYIVAFRMIFRLFRNSCGRESSVFQALGHEVESSEMEQDGHPKALPVTKSTRHLLHPLNPGVLCLQHRI